MSPRIITLTPNPVLDRTLIVPAVNLNEVLRATDKRDDLGGKGFNVSSALKAMGMDSLALGFVGGATGDRLQQMLAQRGIATKLLQIGDETRTNIVVTDTDGHQYLKVNEAGPLVTEREVEQLATMVEQEVRDGDYWVLAGSLPRGVPRDFYARLIPRIQNNGGRVLLDASGPALLHGLAAQPALIKPNALEASEAAGFPVTDIATAENAARSLQARGIEAVALSMGAAGMLAARGNDLVLAAPPQVTAVSAVGLGDAALAGMLWALIRDLPFEQVVRWSVACGTAAAMKPGTSFATLDEVRTVETSVSSRILSSPAPSA
jgi:1-phosphofructokinase family hexose kinase